MYYRKLIPLMAALAAWSSGSAYAAEAAVNAKLTQVEGSVVMNQGKRFVPAKLGTELLVGDRVLALKTGQATVAFADGCAIQIKPGKSITIESQSPCSAGLTTKAPDEGGLLGGDSTKPPIPIYIGGVVLAGMIGSCLADEWPCEEGHRRRHTVSP
jgi:hypothetical protein